MKLDGTLTPWNCQNWKRVGRTYDCGIDKRKCLIQRCNGFVMK